ncbi:hypothetical protein B0H10DRAFT_1755918, partial [Mycena sp. CBHHK59/15]
AFDFVVSPQAPPKENERDAADFIIYIVVHDEKQRPVFLLEVKEDTYRDIPSGRQAADSQMRGRYNNLLYTCPIPILYGLNALGTDIRTYVGDVSNGDVMPPLVYTNPARVVARDYLKNEWDLDILSDEGFNKTKEIV